MTTSFEFATATRIIFGCGEHQQLGSLVREFGRRALLVRGRDARRHEDARRRLAGSDIVFREIAIAREPQFDDIEEAVAVAREFACDVVLGIGGGSVIDAGKAIAALANNPGSALDYVEVIGRHQPLTTPPLPFIAVPTTAGPGAEVTRNAVLKSPTQGVKVSLRSRWMLATVALIDPELMRSMPPSVTAHTGMDALSQLIEPLVSKHAQPLTDALCRDGLRRVARALERATADGGDLDARTDMAYGSLLGGIALANAGLGAVHGLAAPIGGRFDAAHGAVCAILLPPVLASHLDRCQPNDPVHARLTDVARAVFDDDRAQPVSLVPWLTGLVERLGIPMLGDYGMNSSDFVEIARAAQRANSMRGNPVSLDEGDLVAILEKAC